LGACVISVRASIAALAANGDYRRDNLEPYTARLINHYGSGGADISSAPVFSGFMRFLGARLLSSRRFTRHIVLDRWFLHTNLKSTHST